MFEELMRLSPELRAHLAAGLRDAAAKMQARARDYHDRIISLQRGKDYFEKRGDELNALALVVEKLAADAPTEPPLPF